MDSDTTPFRHARATHNPHPVESLFDEVVTAVSAERCVPGHIDRAPAAGRTIILAMGKAAAWARRRRR